MSEEKTYIRVRLEGADCSGCILTIDEAVQELKNIHENGVEDRFVFEPVSMLVKDFESMPEFQGF